MSTNICNTREVIEVVKPLQFCCIWDRLHAVETGYTDLYGFVRLHTEIGGFIGIYIVQCGSVLKCKAFPTETSYNATSKKGNWKLHMVYCYHLSEHLSAHCCRVFLLISHSRQPTTSSPPSTTVYETH
jgi:hypothetical protein